MKYQINKYIIKRKVGNYIILVNIRTNKMFRINHSGDTLLKNIQETEKCEEYSDFIKQMLSLGILEEIAGL